MTERIQWSEEADESQGRKPHTMLLFSNLLLDYFLWISHLISSLHSPASLHIWLFPGSQWMTSHVFRSIYGNVVYWVEFWFSGVVDFNMLGKSVQICRRFRSLDLPVTDRWPFLLFEYFYDARLAFTHQWSAGLCERSLSGVCAWSCSVVARARFVDGAVHCNYVAMGFMHYGLRPAQT